MTESENIESDVSKLRRYDNLVRDLGFLDTIRNAQAPEGKEATRVSLLTETAQSILCNLPDNVYIFITLENIRVARASSQLNEDELLSWGETEAMEYLSQLEAELMQ